MNEQSLSNPMTVIGLVNGMIGGIILVMPILSLKAGTLLIAPTSIITGFFSYYSCQLLLRHLRNYKDLDEAVYEHFGRRRSWRNFYDITIVIAMLVILILYFDLICKQWEGMTSQSPLIPLLNALLLFPFVYVMKRFHLGASLLAYGILSIIGYCIFLLWMLVTAPSGPSTVELADGRFSELAAALGQGFAIQTFFIPILKQNPNRKLYSGLLALTYIIGIAIYTYIGYFGAFSLINRAKPEGAQPETIEQYFGEREWQVVVVEIIYLVHLYSVFPEFLLIAKKRFFGVMEWPEPPNINFKEVMFVATTILVSLIIKLTSISADVIIELNGSIVSFMFVYLIPIGLHVKCVYFSSYMQPKLLPGIKEQPKSEEMNEAKPQHQYQNRAPKDEELNEDANHQAATESTLADHNLCKCQVQYKSKTHQYCQLAVLGVMMLVGITIMLYTLVLIAHDQ